MRWCFVVSIQPVMITIDRSPGINYIDETLAHIDESNSGYHSLIMSDGEGICASKNVADALLMGCDSDWVLFMEDDIAVCHEFYRSVKRWLAKYARDDRRVVAFGAAYDYIKTNAERGLEVCDYPIDQFYGTQCFAIRGDDARSLSEYLYNHAYDREDDGTAYDLLMHDWAKATYPDIHHFSASCPSFVQHIGMTSSIRPRSNIHTFTSWPGKDWTYGGDAK